MSEQADRRAFRRFSVDPLFCATFPELEGVCVLKNVSLNGAFFLNRTPPAVGSRLRLEFVETPLNGYRLVGEVVRHGQGSSKGFAVNFTNPHPRLLRAVYHNDYQTL